MTSNELLYVCIKYDFKRTATKKCLKQMPETNELISNYLNKLVEQAQEEPLWCEAVVKANQRHTGIQCSDEKPFQYVGGQCQEVSLDKAFAISLSVIM